MSFCNTVVTKKALPKFDFDSYGSAFLARNFHKVRALLSEQSDDIFKEVGASIPSHCASLVLFLHDNKQAPVMKIAAALDYSYQLINQRLAILEKQGCVEKFPDPADRRRTLVTLSKRGKNEVTKIRRALKIIDCGIDNLLFEMNVNLLQDSARAANALMSTPLSRRAQKTKRTTRKKTS